MLCAHNPSTSTSTMRSHRLGTYHQWNGNILTLSSQHQPCTTTPNTYPSSSCAGVLKFRRPSATNRSYVWADGHRRPGHVGLWMAAFWRSGRHGMPKNHRQWPSIPTTEGVAVRWCEGTSIIARYDTRMCNSPPRSPVEDQNDVNEHSPPNSTQQYPGIL